MSVGRLAMLIACMVVGGCGDDDATGGGGGADLGADLSASCSYPQEPPAGSANDARCPAAYGGAALSLCTPAQPCPAAGLSCKYYGVGDGVQGCRAIAIMSCLGGDGGTPTWACAN